jgi:hypothetical protein
MSFQLGALSHFKTEDQSKHGNFVRVLGLGGSMAYDWAADSRRARLVGNQDDYVTFAGMLQFFMIMWPGAILLLAHALRSSPSFGYAGQHAAMPCRNASSWWRLYV